MISELLLLLLLILKKNIYEIFKENGIKNIKSINSVLRVKKELKLISTSFKVENL
jgi:hypothetical protein